MERAHPNDDAVPCDPWDLWLMATMEWEGGISGTTAAKCPDPDEPEKLPTGNEISSPSESSRSPPGAARG